MTAYIRNDRLLLTLSFLIPLLLVALALLGNGIYWGSDVSILAGDAYHQYVNVHALYSRILHENSGFFYSWTSGMGLNLYAFASYYMGSFFMPITFFFDVESMPDALYLITLLKFGCIGLSAYISFSNIYKKVDQYLTLAFSISFALMSFLMSQIEIIMWLDVFILLPLIIWGLDKIFKGEGRSLYFVSLTILFIQNYYFGFIAAIFLTLLFAARFFSEKFSIWKTLDFVVSSLLSGLTSAIMLVPMYLDLKANGQSFTELTGKFTDNSWSLDLFAKNFLGSYDTTQFDAVPMIYVGLIPLVLSIVFFFISSINWKFKVGMFFVLGFIITSFYLNALDLAWQGFHSPNMFLHRYSFTFSICILIMAFEACSHFQEVRLWKIVFALSFLTLGFVATIFSKHYDYVEIHMMLLTGLVLFAILVLFIGKKQKYISGKLFSLLMLMFALVDIGINGYYQVWGVREEWAFASRTHYNEQNKKLGEARDYIVEDSKNRLTRTDNVRPDTANDGMKYGYNTIAQFSSVRNSNSGAVMAELGFQTDGHYLNLRYPGNTLLMDSILGINYNINYSGQPQKFGFDPFGGTSTNVTKNFYSQSLGIFVPGSYEDATILPDNPLENQTNFVNALTKSKQTFFTQLFVSKQSAVGMISNQNGRVSLYQEKKSEEPISLSYEIKIPANKQVYIHIPNLTYGDSDHQTMMVETEDFSYTMPTSNTGEYFNLGYYSQETAKKIDISFPDSESVNFDMIDFWMLDINTYTQTMSKLSQNKVSVDTAKNGADFTFDASEAGELFLSIPYDEGWVATMDGKAVNLEKAQSGFLKVDAPAGKHKLEMRFVPNGMKYGILCFMAGITLFFLYEGARKKQNKKH